MSDKKENVGIDNTGDMNTGYRNTGDMNTGNWNTGNMNTGYRNTGNMNTGDMNTGNMNTGYRNTGNWNTGNMNTGNWNTGNMNTGYRNTGDWNTSNRNTGYMNTNEPTVRMFNKDTGLKFGEISFPSYWYFNLTEWVYEEDMTDEEKEAHKEEYKITGGYLKVYDWKDAWKKAWDNASVEDRELTKKLPNFDAEIFEEITGIKIDEPTVKKEITVDGRKYKLVE